jgi:hypothetical protein
VIEFLRRYNHLLFVLVTVFLAARFGASILLVAIAPIMLIMLLKQLEIELLMTVIWLLFLSDYTVPSDQANPMEWAKTLKAVGPLMLLAAVISRPEIRNTSNPIFLKLVPFFIITWIGLVYALNINIGIQKTLSYILLFFTVPKLLGYLMQRDGLRPVLDLVFFLIFIALSSYIAIVIDNEHAFIKESRLSGFFGNPNGLAIFITLLFCLLYTLRGELMRVGITLRIRWLLLPILLLLILTASRNGVLSVLMLFTFVYIFKNNVIPMLLGAFVLSFFILLIDASAVGLVQFFGIEEYFRIQTLEEGSGRSIAWSFAWQRIQDYFFVGGGFGHDENIMRANYMKLTKLGHEGGVHNSYLSMWFDAGVLGVIAYFSAIVSMFVQANRRNYFALPVLLTVLFNTIFESWLVASLNPFTILFVIILTVLVNGKEMYPQLEGKK